MGESIEITLKDDTGGQPVDDSPSLLFAHTGFPKQLLRLFGGEGFIPADDGHRQTGLEPSGKPVDLVALDPLAAVKAERITWLKWFPEKD